MKLKTIKALSKRIKITKTGKQIKRKAGQDHFNSKENGNTRRNKKSDVELHSGLRTAIEAMLPYHK